MPPWADLERICGHTIPTEARQCCPVGDWLLVVIEKAPSQSKGGIVYTDQTKDEETGGSGWVVNMGPEAGHLLAMAMGRAGHPEVALGAKIAFGKYVGHPLMVHDNDRATRSRFILLKEEHVLAVLDVPSLPTKPNGDHRQ